MLALLKHHARLIIVVIILLAATNLFLIHFFPERALYFWVLGAAMIFAALVIAVFLFLFYA